MAITHCSARHIPRSYPRCLEASQFNIIRFITARALLPPTSISIHLWFTSEHHLKLYTMRSKARYPRNRP
jgi:hypothetical protein